MFFHAERGHDPEPDLKVPSIGEPPEAQTLRRTIEKYLGGALIAVDPGSAAAADLIPRRSGERLEDRLAAVREKAGEHARLFEITRRVSPPVTVEIFREALERAQSGDRTVPPELLRGIDEFNMLFVKQLTGLGGGPLTASWSALFQPAEAAGRRGAPIFDEDALEQSALYRRAAACLPPPHGAAALNDWAAAPLTGPAPDRGWDDLQLAGFLSRPGSAGRAGTDPAAHALEVLTSVFGYFEEQGRRAYPFEDVCRARLCAEARAAGERAPERRAALLEALNEGYPQVLFEHLRRFRASYLSAADLEELGVSEAEHRAKIFTKIHQSQLLGLVHTRAGALWYGSALAGLLGKPRGYDPERMLMRSGAELKDFVAVEELSGKNFEDEGFHVRRFRCRSREQFGPWESDDDIRAELRESGNYPALLREMREFSINPDEIVARLRRREALNLVELDAFCGVLQWKRGNYPNARGSLKEARNVSAGMMSHAVVERPGDPELDRIAICVGFQGGPHTGDGVRHVLWQRGRDGTLDHFRKPGETDAAAAERFVEDAVLYTAGAAAVKTPSRLFPETHFLLTGAVRGRNDRFVSLVIARSPDAGRPGEFSHDIVTVLFFPDAAALRRNFVKELRGWTEKQTEGGASWETLGAAEILGPVNKLLKGAGQAEISLHEILPEALFVARRAMVRTRGMPPRLRGLAAPPAKKLDDVVFGASVDAGGEEVQADFAEVGSIESLGAADEPSRAAMAFSLGAAGRAAPEGDDTVEGEGYLFNPAMAHLLTRII